MALGDLTRDGVLKAIAEFDRIGRDAFLRRYGFGQSRSYFVRYEGRLYDSKVIAGAAHAYSSEGAKPLRYFDFSGGFATVQATLNRLGFEVVSGAAAPALKEWRETFVVGANYTRDQIAELIGYPIEKRRGGDWATGYTKFESSYFVFCNVGEAGRTGHDYPNRWDGRDLIWFGKSRTRIDQPQVQEMVGGEFDVLIFWRASDRAAFTFAGLARALEVEDNSPVEVLWSFDALEPTPDDVAAKPHPTFNRGPRPSPGERHSTVFDGPCSTYLMVLDGLSADVACAGEPGSIVIKVGLSNEPQRRLRQLNAGFPPRASFGWKIKTTRSFASFDEAFDAESRLLEAIRERGHWIGGEFAALPASDLSYILAMMSAERPA